jgi:hypothetical protein
MSAKQLSFWERHAGALVVGVASLVVIALLTSSFWPAASPTPSEIDARLRDQATALRDRLGAEAPAPIELPDPPTVERLLEASLAGRVTPADTLPLRAPALGPAVEGGDPGRAVVFAVPELPPPGAAIAGSHLGTLADGVIDEHPALIGHLPAADPPDLVWNTAAARVDLAELRRRLATQPAGLEAAPEAWFFGHPGLILDVVIERQELVAGAWTPAITLEAIPGAATLRDGLDAVNDAAGRDEILEQALDPGNALDIVQPPFYPLRSGAWSPPHLAVAAEVGDEPRHAELRFLVARRASLIRYLEARYGVSYDDKAPPPGEGDRGRGVPGPPPDGFGPDSGGDKRHGDQDRTDADERAIQHRIEQIRKISERIAQLIAQLGQDAEDVAPAPLDLANADQIWVWGHDLTARQGATYRYAVSLRLYNPFFGRRRSLLPEQGHLADAFTIDTPRGPWSGPVVAERLTRVWITRADAAEGPADLGRATAEVDRFFDGRLWRGVFRVEPGDAVGRRRVCRFGDDPEATLVDFTTGLTVLDILRPPDPVPGVGTVLLQDTRTGELQPLRDTRLDGPAARAAVPGARCRHG